jgi:hypothetical protein
LRPLGDNDNDENKWRTDMTSDKTSSQDVYDYGGVRIGTATAAGDAYDHAHVRIGTVTADGVVRDHARVRIGHVRATAAGAG